MGVEKTSPIEQQDELNFGSIDPKDLPPIHEAMLTLADLNALFLDLRDCAGEVQLLTRGPKESGGNLRDRLESIRRRLESGELGKVQIRYRWQEAKWIDTIEVLENKIRLVRIRHETFA